MTRRCPQVGLPRLPWAGTVCTPKIPGLVVVIFSKVQLINSASSPFFYAVTRCSPERLACSKEEPSSATSAMYWILAALAPTASEQLAIPTSNGRKPISSTMKRSIAKHLGVSQHAVCQPAAVLCDAAPCEGSLRQPRLPAQRKELRPQDLQAPATLGPDCSPREAAMRLSVAKRPLQLTCQQTDG